MKKKVQQGRNGDLKKTRTEGVEESKLRSPKVNSKKAKVSSKNTLKPVTKQITLSKSASKPPLTPRLPEKTQLIFKPTIKQHQRTEDKEAMEYQK